MAQKPTFSQMPGQGRPKLPGRTELTQAFDKTKSAKSGALRATNTTVIVQQPAPPASVSPEIDPAQTTTYGTVRLSDAPDNGVSIALTPNARVVQPFGASGTDHAAGIVPDPGVTAGTTKFLREDGTWDIPAGGGGGTNDLYRLTAPALGAFSWVNQGSATVVGTTLGFHALSIPGTAGNGLRMRVQSVAAAPYTITAAMVATTAMNQYHQGGIVLYDSSAGTALTWNFIVVGSTLNFVVGYWNSVTSLNSNLFSAVALNVQGPIWLRIRDDGTTRYYSYSSDGESYLVIGSDASGTFVTPDQTGFFADLNSGAGDMINTVVSWTNAADVPFTPSALPSLVQWLDVSAITGHVDGDAIGTWTDSSTSGNDVAQPTGGNQPIYKTGIINGLPVLRFSGGQYLYASSVVASLTDVTIFMVLNTQPGNGATVSLGFGCSGAGSTGLWIYGSTQDFILIRPANTDINASGTESQGVAYYHTIQLDSAAGAHFRVNGAAIASNAGGIAFGGTAVETIGAAYAGSYLYNGDIAEIIVCNASLSTSDRNQVEAYLAAKYGL